MEDNDGFYLTVKGLALLMIDGHMSVDEAKPIIRKLHKKWRLLNHD